MTTFSQEFFHGKSIVIPPIQREYVQPLDESIINSFVDSLISAYSTPAPKDLNYIYGLDLGTSFEAHRRPAAPYHSVAASPLRSRTPRRKAGSEIRLSHSRFLFSLLRCSHRKCRRDSQGHHPPGGRYHQRMLVYRKLDRKYHCRLYTSCSQRYTRAYSKCRR